MRNFNCPQYSLCLGHKAKSNAKIFDCSPCPNRDLQEFDPEQVDYLPFYSLLGAIFYPENSWKCKKGFH